MTKYYDEEELANTRCYRNQDLYKEISKNELDNYDIKSNATVIGDNKNDIDVEKIKKILDTRYNDAPKRQSIRLEEKEEEVIEKEPTKEYDINVIIEKAKEGKQENYEEERLKDIHNTEYDILKKLDSFKKEEDSIEEDIDERLKTLINTITINENKNSSNDSEPLDILSDLKGSENTETLDGLKEEISDFDTEIEKIVKKEEGKTSNFDTKMVNSFYTSSNALKNSDFEELDDDFKKSVESNNIIVKILIGLVIIVFIVGIVLLIKTFF